MRRTTLLVVLVAFVFSCGGQWPVLQCVAWANMVREYSEMVPLGKAVQMTFSGEYPCALCKMVAERKSSGQQKALAFQTHDKKQVAEPVGLAIPAHLSAEIQYHASADSLVTRTDAPPTPPPRFWLS